MIEAIDIEAIDLCLTPQEAEEVRRSRSQIVTLKRGENIKCLARAFTEHGGIMAATVLNSPRALNQAVRRNEDRFPADFRFQLTREERDEVVTNCDHLRNLKYAAVNQAVRTNGARFPEDFAFQLTPEEVGDLRSQSVTSSAGHVR